MRSENSKVRVPERLAELCRLAERFIAEGLHQFRGDVRARAEAAAPVILVQFSPLTARLMLAAPGTRRAVEVYRAAGEELDEAFVVAVNDVLADGLSRLPEPIRAQLAALDPEAVDYLVLIQPDVPSVRGALAARDRPISEAVELFCLKETTSKTLSPSKQLASRRAPEDHA